MAQRFRSLLSVTPELRPLLSRAQILTALQRQFASVAPPYLAQSCQVTGLQGGILAIAAANSTVAAKLRQLAPELVVLMQNRGGEVSGIRVKVQVTAPPPPRKGPHRLSSTARNALDGLSAGLEDSPLKRALKKLSRQAG